MPSKKMNLLFLKSDLTELTSSLMYLSRQPCFFRTGSIYCFRVRLSGRSETSSVYESTTVYRSRVILKLSCSYPQFHCFAYHYHYGCVLHEDRNLAAGTLKGLCRPQDPTNIQIKSMTFPDKNEYFITNEGISINVSCWYWFTIGKN